MNKLLKQTDRRFDATLDFLEKKYFNHGGDDEAEVIVSWSKRDAKQFGWVSLYATNSTISNAIKRCRKGIRAVRYNNAGAELFVDVKYVRSLHTVLKVAKS